jgi:CRISPR-associated protein Csd1
MILQALKEYYDRKAVDPAAEMAPLGFEWKQIPFIIDLKADGSPVSLECTTEGEGYQRHAKRCLVPEGVKRGKDIAANLLWDNPEYALGIVLKSKKMRVIAQHTEFRRRIGDLKCDDPGLRAVKLFMRTVDKEKALKSYPAWEQLSKENKSVSFRLAGDSGLIAERPAVRSAIQRFGTHPSANQIFCLVSGTNDDLERLHAPIKGVWETNASGAKVVSFNMDAFNSYGKKQGANAPIGKKAAFAYTTALNHLLRKNSGQRFAAGNNSVVFWAEKTCELEHQLADLMAEPPKEDPDRNVRAVEILLKSPSSSAVPRRGDDACFCILGLSPNVGRLAVHFWFSSTVGEVSDRLRQHFKDIDIVHGAWEKGVLSLFRLLLSMAAQAEADNISPSLAGDTMRAIFEGLPYPQSLLQAVIRRIRAEQEVNYPRASLIKAYVNRSTRLANPKIAEELKVGLDLDNVNIGYRLGRLLATLEKIQKEASSSANTTMRDRFYGAASGTPRGVFGNLMRINHYYLIKLSKIGRGGRDRKFEQLLGQIMKGIKDFPVRLGVVDQGRFAVGYYHQKQDFFHKKDDSPEV